MLIDQATGTTFEAISGGVLRSHPVPVPPKGTEQRIVASIDDFFAELDDGEAALTRARDDLETYRKSLLKAAVTGELTADWREANPPQETGEQLLQRILADRKARWDAEPKNRGKPFDTSADPDVAALPALPDTWSWIALGHLIADGPQNGVYLPRTAYGSGNPILRIDDFSSGKARRSEKLQLVRADPSVVEGYALREGDLVINRVNSPSHLGKAFAVKAQHLPAMFESNMMRFQPSCAIRADFLECYLMSDIGRRLLCENAKAAVNQSSINQKDVANTLVPLPPVAEQFEITSLVERLRDESDSAEATAHGIRKRSSSLRQSILNAAFRGELVQ